MSVLSPEPSFPTPPLLTPRRSNASPLAPASNTSSISTGLQLPVQPSRSRPGWSHRQPPARVTRRPEAAGAPCFLGSDSCLEPYDRASQSQVAKHETSTPGKNIEKGKKKK